MSNPNIELAAELFSKRAEQLPESVQFALISVLPNIPNGAFWGFVPVTECRKYAESLKGDKYISLKRVSPEVALVEVNPDYIVKAAMRIDDSLITEKDITDMRTGLADGMAAFEKFLANNADKGFRNKIGIYCINDTSTITIKGVVHPAFRVNLSTALSLFSIWGYAIRVGNNYVSPSQVLHLGSKFFENVTISPTMSGVFLDVGSTYNKEQVAALKKQRLPKRTTK